jgi:hypothetical protein
MKGHSNVSEEGGKLDQADEEIRRILQAECTAIVPEEEEEMGNGKNHDHHETRK